MRGHAEQRADGNYAGAADPGDENVEWSFGSGSPKEETGDVDLSW